MLLTDNENLPHACTLCSAVTAHFGVSPRTNDVIYQQPGKE